MRVRSAIDMIAVTHEKVVHVIKICSLIYLIQTAWATLLVCLFTDVEVSSNLKDKRTDNRDVKKITCCFLLTTMYLKSLLNHVNFLISVTTMYICGVSVNYHHSIP